MEVSGAHKAADLFAACGFTYIEISMCVANTAEEFGGAWVGWGSLV